MAKEPDTALTKSESTGTSPAGTPKRVWLLVLALAGLAAYAGYTVLQQRHQHADSEMVRKALASENTRLEASVLTLKDELKKSKEANASLEATVGQSRADAHAASAKLIDLESKVGVLGSKVAEALTKAKESAEKHLNAQLGFEAAEEAKAKLMSENSSLKNQINEAQKKLDAAVSDLTGIAQKSQDATPPLSPLPEPSYP
jgi:chromosome segregation ATPase